MIIHTPNPGGLFGARGRYANRTHEQSFTPVSISQIAVTSGFAACRAFEDRPAVHGIKNGVRGRYGWCSAESSDLCWIMGRSSGSDCIFNRDTIVGREMRRGTALE
jgi:hypothetical protein